MFSENWTAVAGENKFFPWWLNHKQFPHGIHICFYFPQYITNCHKKSLQSLYVVQFFMIRWVELSDIFCSKNTIIFYTCVIYSLVIRIMQQRFQNSPFHMMDPTHFHSTELGKILQLVSDPKSDILGYGHLASLSQINSQKMAFTFWMAKK